MIKTKFILVVFCALLLSSCDKGGGKTAAPDLPEVSFSAHAAKYVAVDAGSLVEELSLSEGGTYTIVFDQRYFPELDMELPHRMIGTYNPSKSGEYVLNGFGTMKAGASKAGHVTMIVSPSTLGLGEISITVKRIENNN